MNSIFKDKYFEYDTQFLKLFINLKEKINNLRYSKAISKELSDLEREISFFTRKF